MSDIFSHLVYGFMGAGSICQAVLQGFLQKANIPKQKVLLSSRSPVRLAKTAKRFAVQSVSGNEELVVRSQVVFLCMKPEDVIPAIEPLSCQFNEDHTLFSFPAGVSLNVLQKLLPHVKRLIRVVPNTPVSVGEGVFAYSLVRDDPGLQSFVEELFAPLGKVFKMKEENLSPFTVSASSGVAFVLELMQYWNEWLEDHHFSPEMARKISTQTFLGAALWAKAFPQLSLAQLQSRVASKNGMTAEGLKAFNTAQLDSILHYGFEKTVLREKKIIFKKFIKRKSSNVLHCAQCLYRHWSCSLWFKKGEGWPESKALLLYDIVLKKLTQGISVGFIKKSFLVCKLRAGGLGFLQLFGKNPGTRMFSFIFFKVWFFRTGRNNRRKKTDKGIKK